MHDDIPTLLHAAAADPSHTPDFVALATRGRHQQLAGRTATALVAAVVLATGGIALWPERDPGRIPAIDQQPDTPSGHEQTNTTPAEDTPGTWQEPSNYDYTLASCGGGRRLLSGTFHIEVREYEVVRIEPLSAFEGPGDAAILLEEAPTIGELTSRVDQANQQGAAVAKITYAESGQRPARIEIDPRSNVIDDEECYELRDYTPTDPSTPAGGGTRRGPVEFSRAFLVSPTEIELQLPTCNGDPAITVQETTTEVRIHVVATQQLGDADACLDDPRVHLDSPLGSRTLVDANSGEQIAVEDS